MKTFQEILKAELEKPVELKKNGVVTGSISPMEAMVKSVMNNAMKGDLSSIAFINTLTKTVDPEKEREMREQHKVRVAEIANQLKAQLENEKVYDGQDLDISEVAEIKVMLEDLNQMVAAPDFERISTDIKTGKQTVSPLIALRDKQRDLFQAQLNKLRQEATNRIITKRNMRL